MNKKPELKDYYDGNDPRGCSSTEYAKYETDLLKWEKLRIKSLETNDLGDDDDDDDEYNPYCVICTSCGESGCCSPVSCKQHPKGKYCEGNLNELKFGYLMFTDLFELISKANNKLLKDELNKIYDTNWDIIFKNN